MYFKVQPPYENLERLELLRILERRGFLLDDIEEMARRELIDLCVDNDVEHISVPEEDSWDYPVRRPVRASLPSWFIDGTGPVRVRWINDWSNGAVLDREPWAQGADSADLSEVVLEIVRVDPPVLVAVSRPAPPPTRRPRRGSGAPRGEHPRDDGRSRVLLPQIVLWDGVISRVAADRAVRGDDVWVGDDASALRSAAAHAVAAPEAIFLDAGACSPGVRVDELVALARVLQDAYGGSRSAGSQCDVCGRLCEVLGVHLDRPSHRPLRLELQDHVDDAALVCSDCHTLLHGTSVLSLRRALRPACPSCSDRIDVRPLVLGMPASEPIDDDVILGGCDIGPGPVPQWRCLACEQDFAVVVAGAMEPKAGRRRPMRAALDEIDSGEADAPTGRSDETRSSPPGSTVAEAVKDDFLALARALRVSDEETDLSAFTLGIPGGFLEADVTDDGATWLLRAFVAIGQRVEVESWIRRQGVPESGTWTVEAVDGDGTTFEVEACVVYERPVATTDWASDPIVADVRALAAAWVRDGVALLTGARPEVGTDPVAIMPSNAWLVIGDDASYPTADSLAELRADGEAGWFDLMWTASKNVVMGDLVLVYFMAPRKAVHFVARAASSGFFHDDIEVNSDREVGTAQQWTYLTPLVEIEPIAFARLQSVHHGHLILKGRSGKYLRPEVIDELHFVAKDPADQALVDAITAVPVGLADLPRPDETTLEQWRQIAGGALRLEADVTRHIVEPLLRHLLGGTGVTWQLEYPVRSGRVDLAVLDDGRPVASIEVKLAMPVLAGGAWSSGRPAQQLRRYTDELGTPGVLIDANRVLLFAVGADEPCAEIDRRTASQAELDQIRAHLLSGRTAS